MTSTTDELVNEFMEQLRELSGVESPADLLARVAGLFCSLHGAALDVYRREYLTRSDVQEVDVVDAVFYYYDHRNQAAVADRLGLPVETFMLMLAAYLVGENAGCCRRSAEIETAYGMRL